MKKQKQSIHKFEREIQNSLVEKYGNCNPYQSDNIMAAGSKEIEENKGTNRPNLVPEDAVFKMLTLFEFENSILITLNFSEQYRTLVADLSQRLQTEFSCRLASERALAHLTAQNYVRTLELQRSIYLNLSQNSYNDVSTRRLAILEKAYDRANQQYIMTLHTLKTAKMPPINVKLVTQNAMFGLNHQVVNEAKPKETEWGEIINAK